MKRLFGFLLELCVEIPREAYRYLCNEHRIAVSKKLREETNSKKKEIAVYFKAGGYRWSVRDKLVGELRKLGVTRIKCLHDQYDAVLALLTPSQIETMSNKRWLPGMLTASEMLAIEEARLRSNFDTYKNFDRAQFAQSLKELREQYRL